MSMHSSLSAYSATVLGDSEKAQQADLSQSWVSRFGESVRDNWLSVLVICLMCVTMVALFRYPVRRIFANVEVNYNEGWNAYRAAMVAKGVRLYGAPPQGFGTPTAYPPISFHLVSWL